MGTKDAVIQRNRKNGERTKQFDQMPLIISIFKFILLSIGLVDINVTYLQSGPTRKRIYVHTPRKMGKLAGVDPKPTKNIIRNQKSWQEMRSMLYEMMLETMRLEIVYGVSQMFVKRRETGLLQFVLVKIMGDLLLPGTDEAIESFLKDVKRALIEAGPLSTESSTSMDL